MDNKLSFFAAAQRSEWFLRPTLFNVLVTFTCTMTDLRYPAPSATLSLKVTIIDHQPTGSMRAYRKAVGQ